MILINRCDCPECLSNNPSDIDRYNRPAVVSALWGMQHGKCCYSEKYLDRNGHGKAVEHFYPQVPFTFLRNQWSNLLLASSHCNGKKSNDFPLILAKDGDKEKFETVLYIEETTEGTPAIIDPSDPEIDPEEHLTYNLDDLDDALYGQIAPRNGSLRGKITIDITGIDDAVFFRERNERLIDILDNTYRCILRAASAVKHHGADEELLNIELGRFTMYLDSSQQYAGLAREYARLKKLDERFEIDIPGPVF